MKVRKVMKNGELFTLERLLAVPRRQSPSATHPVGFGPAH
jgi:hypothetical protein